MRIETDRNYKMSFKTEYKKLNGSITIQLEAKLTLGIETNFSEIVQFKKDVKEIISEIKKAYKRGSFIEIELTASNYRTTWKDDGNFNNEQLSFDRWFFEGYQDNDGGLYLNPDTRYTEECHDIWLDYKQDIFESLSTI